MLTTVHRVMRADNFCHLMVLGLALHNLIWHLGLDLIENSVTSRTNGPESKTFMSRMALFLQTVIRKGD